jgi:hypothetical protein
VKLDFLVDVIAKALQALEGTTNTKNKKKDRTWYRQTDHHKKNLSATIPGSNPHRHPSTDPAHAALGGVLREFEQQDTRTRADLATF